MPNTLLSIKLFSEDRLAIAGARCKVNYFGNKLPIISYWFYEKNEKRLGINKLTHYVGDRFALVGEAACFTSAKHKQGQNSQKIRNIQVHGYYEKNEKDWVFLNHQEG